MDERIAQLEVRVAVLEAKLLELQGHGGPMDLLGQPTDPMALVRQAIGLWNTMAAGRGLAGASLTKLAAPRAQAIRRCLADAGGLEGWRRALELTAASAFLCGVLPGKTWKAGLDFIIRPDKFQKLMEGGYDQDYAKHVSGAAAGLAPGGHGPSRADLRSGVIEGLGRAGRLEGG